MPILPTLLLRAVDLPFQMLVVPGLVLATVAFGVLAGWISARGRVRRFYSAPLRLKWAVDEPALTVPNGWDEELGELGYRRAGTLLQAEPTERTLAVYLHERLPIYAFVIFGAGLERPAVHLETFFSGGERITTSGLPGARTTGALVVTEIPRLMQYRVGGTPTALDGQHVGTVRAWTGGSQHGSRQPLPATREALLAYLESDHARTREALQARGWVSLGTWLKLLAGQSKNVLQF